MTSFPLSFPFEPFLHLVGVGVLHKLAVETAADAKVVWVGQGVRGHDCRTDGRKGVTRLRD